MSGPRRRDSARHVRVSAQALGRAVDNHVRAQFQRPQQNRRGEGVVNHQYSSALPRQLRYRLYVRQAEQRVGDGLYERQLRGGCERAFHRVKVSPVNELYVDAQPRQVLAQQQVRSAVESVGCEYSIARFHQREQRNAHRAHAGREGHGGVRVFQVGYDTLQYRHIRVGVARIYEPVLTSFVYVVHLLEALYLEH